MRKRGISLIIMVLLVVFMSGCNKLINKDIDNSNSGNNALPRSGSKPSDDNKSKDNSSQTIENDPVRDKIKTMSMDEKIGQLVMVGIDGYINDIHSREMIQNYHVGGFILLGQNIRDSKQALTLVNSLKDINTISNNQIPLFIAIDQEGGRVNRMPGEFSKLPTNRAIGQVDNADFSFKIGTVLGEELKQFGMNVDFAPVLDINSNPKNPVIGDRSFGVNADIVSTLGVQTMKGIQSQGIISGVKLFPGHGDTSVDSHIGLPLVNNDINRLNSFELVPFKEAINNGADIVMVAHILLPKIDPNNPASFSKIIITDILRNNLKYNGVVITDDMTMGAITKNYDIKASAVKSLNAGSDIILVCHDFNSELTVINGIKAAVKDGTIDEKSLDDKVYRILKLKDKYNLSDKKSTAVNPGDINDKIKNLLATFMKK